MAIPIFSISTWGDKNNVGSYALSYSKTLEKIMTTIFKYDGLPEEVEGWMIEKFLFWHGKAAFWKLAGKFLVTPIVKVDWDLYNQITIANPVPYNGKGPTGVILHRNDFNPTEKGMKAIAVFIQNNLDRTNTLKQSLPLLQTLDRLWIELNNDIKNSRSIKMFIAPNEKQGKELKKELNSFYSGDNPFAVNSQTVSKQLQEAKEFGGKSNAESLHNSLTKIKTEINEIVGIPFDSRPDKKERVVTQEINISQIQVNEILQSMLNFREKAVKEINKVFGLNISVKLEEKVDAAFEVNNQPIQETNNKQGENNNEI